MKFKKIRKFRGSESDWPSHLRESFEIKTMCNGVNNVIRKVRGIVFLAICFKYIANLPNDFAKFKTNVSLLNRFLNLRKYP